MRRVSLHICCYWLRFAVLKAVTGTCHCTSVDMCISEECSASIFRPDVLLAGGTLDVNFRYFHQRLITK